MPKVTEVKVPDLGDFADVPVIEIHVKAGDVVNEEDPLITLESDKATMDVPSPAAGRVGELRVKLGDLLSAGSPVLLLDTEGALTEPPSLADQQEPPGQEAPEPVAAVQEPARPFRRDRAAGPAPLRRLRRRACRTRCAQAGPRARRGLGHGDRDRAEGPHHQAGPARDRPRARRRAGRAEAGRSRCRRDTGNPRAGLLEIRPGRGPAAVTDPADLRFAPAPVMAERSARHAQRRGGHHRTRCPPQGTRHRGPGRGLPGDAAGLPDEGVGLGAPRVPPVQQLADPGERCPRLQGLLPHRRRGRHRRRPGRPGDQGRRSQGCQGAEPGTQRRLGQGQGGQAGPG